jgi:hypothetical protein
MLRSSATPDPCGTIVVKVAKKGDSRGLPTGPAAAALPITTRNRVSSIEAPDPNAAAAPVTAPATAIAYSHSAPNTAKVWPGNAPSMAST